MLTTLLSGVALAVLLPVTAFAVSAGTEEITGTVTSSANHRVAGAQVVVVCDNNTQKTTTASTGTYSVQYTATQCPNKALANVIATYDGHSGSNSGEIKDNNLLLAEKLNVAVVPRFGLVTGATATVLGGVGYLTIRRRENSSNKA
jgi:hypothetical protein